MKYIVEINFLNMNCEDEGEFIDFNLESLEEAIQLAAIAIREGYDVNVKSPLEVGKCSKTYIEE